MATRRQLLALIAVATASVPLLGRSPRRIRALAFDAFVLFNPQTVVKRTWEIVGEKGDALFAAASAKLFGYTWYYTSAGTYLGFEELAADAFMSAAQGLDLKLSEADVERIVESYASLELWPDVLAALQTLRRHGVRLVMLSNLPEHALKANLRAGRIDQLFELVLSTDQSRSYKPSPKAYDLAVSALKIPKDQIGFAASASWDASGATWFGYSTVWVNRTGAPSERAHAAPAIASNDMSGVLRLAGLDLTS